MIFIRVVIAVLAGYLLLAVSFNLTMVPAVSLVNPDRLRDADTGIMTNWFIFMVQFPVAISTAVVGGAFTAWLASRPGRKYAISALIWFVIIVGLIQGGRFLRQEVMSVSQSDGAPMQEVASDFGGVPPVPPIWNVFMLPFVGGLGVLLGGRMVTRAATALSLEPTLPSSSPPSPPASPAS